MKDKMLRVQKENVFFSAQLQLLSASAGSVQKPVLKDLAIKSSPANLQ
jgi:hypothetical protein